MTLIHTHAILREWRQIQDQYKEYLSLKFYDYNLVLTLPNGRPVENRIMEKEFSKLREKAGLPYVVFHSLRHSNTTYKLKLNHGNLKATQGDTGHAQIDMITRCICAYETIILCQCTRNLIFVVLDEDRKVNAQKFEATFYARGCLKPVMQNTILTAAPLNSVNPLKNVTPPENANADLTNLIAALEQLPKLVSMLTKTLKQNAISS